MEAAQSPDTMKRTLVTSLAFTLSLPLVGCMEMETSMPNDCQPGDIECAENSGGGKDDGFGGDYQNDPKYFSQHLEYHLADLPLKGWRDEPVWKDTYPEAVGKAATVWADTYWPTSHGSHNTRWLGSTTKSPLEKYDEVYNHNAGCETYPSKYYGSGAKEEWDTYYSCAGPAAKWQSKNFQGGGEMHDGIDNDGDGKIDEYGDDGIDGIAGWWGTCHAWTPASMLVPEPQHAVTMDGVTFEVGDIKALIQNAFDRTSAVMLGGRCNSKEITHTVEGSANDACSDVNPGAMHVIMTNFLGINQLPLIEDRTANYEVWNQPVVGYDITQQNEVTPAEAMTCVGAEGDTWTYNTDAAKLYDVRMTVSYVTESSASRTPVGYRNNVRTDRYHYILEVGDTGKVIGGRYCKDGENNHIDFLWSPTGSWRPSNPNVDVNKVKELIKASVAPEDGGGTGGATATFESSPNASIPDNDPAGVNVDVAVTGVQGATALAVSVDITHTYRGDLVLELRKNGTAVKTLVANEGGSAEDLVETYTLSGSEIGSDVNGTWTLNVADTAAIDTGTVNKVTLAFSVPE